MTARAPEDLDVDRLNAEGRRRMTSMLSLERYRSRKAAGLCTRGASHGPAAAGHTLCDGCLVDQRFEQNSRNAAKRPPKRTLTCLRCGKPGRNSRGCPCPVPDGFNPRRARAQRGIEYRASLRAQGLCPNNPKHARPEPGFSRCAACRARGKATS